MRQTSKSVVLAGAIVLGFVTASLVYVYLAAQTQKSPDRVSVVVARHGIPPGTVVDTSMLDVRSFPRGTAPQGAASAREMVIGKVSGIPIKAGEPISMSYVEARNRLSQMIPPFMRAVTVAVDPISGVGGFLKPGDHVDVIATFNVNQGTLTKTVLQDVTLVAMGPQVVGDQTAQVPGRTTQTSSAANATLVVLPSDAEKLVLADSKGKLRLALRRADDLSRIRPHGVTSRAMLGVVPPDVPKEKPQTVQTSTPAPPPYAPQYILPPVTPPAKTRPAVSKASLFTRLKPLPLPSGQKRKAPRTIEIIRGTKVERTVVAD